MKASLTAEVAAAKDEAAADAIRLVYDKKEKSLENDLDHCPLESAPLPRLHHNRCLAHIARMFAQCTWRWRWPTTSCPSRRLHERLARPIHTTPHHTILSLGSSFARGASV